ncbi:MAG: metallophosphoesterase family protein [Candidatus Odinarchaeota archaeon]
MAKKYAIFGDVHGNYTALKTACDYIESEDIDKIFVTGDLVGYYTEPKRCIQKVKTIADLCIAGNHDKIIISDSFEEEIELFNYHAQQALIWTRNHLLGKFSSRNNHSSSNLDEMNYLKKLHLREKTNLPNGERLLLTHGSPEDPWEYVFLPDTDENIIKKKKWRDLRDKLNYWFEKENVKLIIVGHTHVPHVLKLEDGYLINPGSIGQPRDRDPRASFIIMTLKQNKSLLDPSTVEFKVVRLKYNIDEVVEKAKKAGLPEFLANRLYVGK